MEQSFLAYLRGRCRHLPQLPVGIGDDAAVWNPPGESSIVCSDQIIDGVDFRSEEHPLRDIGFKALAINLSDVAAMGGEPTAAVVTLSLPEREATRIAAEVYEGILELCERYQIAVAGGDLSTYDGPLAISITLLGNLPAGAAWLRSGAGEGDAIVVTGRVGGSILGRHLRPEPRIELVRQIRQQAEVHAAIDISDGLSLDLDRLCAASGVGAELDLDAIPIHEDAIRLAESTGRTAFEHAWSDGEDFELILCLDPADAQRVCRADLGVKLTQIGNCVGRTGLWQRSAGKLSRLSPQGYLH